MGEVSTREEDCDSSHQRRIPFLHMLLEVHPDKQVHQWERGQNTHFALSQDQCNLAVTFQGVVLV